MEKTMEGIVLDCKVDGKMIHFSFPDRTAFYEAVEDGRVPEKVNSASVFGQKLPEIDNPNVQYSLDTLVTGYLMHQPLNNQELPIFFDMDGTLAVWQSAPIDEVMSPGFFQNRRPMGSMIQAAKKIMEMGHPVYITSKVISGTTSVEDKNIWLDRHFPQIRRENRFFIPYENKDKNVIPLSGGVKPYYILIDDSTHYGLAGWSGVGIKVDNGINNTNRSWKGYMVSSQSYPEVIAATIDTLAVLEAKKKRQKPLLELVLNGIRKHIVVFPGPDESSGRGVFCRIGDIDFDFLDNPCFTLDQFFEDMTLTQNATAIARVLKNRSGRLSEEQRLACIELLCQSAEER